MTPQVFAHPAPATPQNKGAVLIERLLTLTDVMRNTAAYMLHCPDPAPRHAQELTRQSITPTKFPKFLNHHS